MIKKLLLEPLFQFLFLGALLYGYYTQTAQNNMLEREKIPITKDEILQIKAKYKNEFNRELSGEILDAYIQQKYQEKILLNEAYTLGLDKKDEVISQRLLKQMHYILLNSSELVEPSEKELFAYYKKNIADYSEVQTLSFSQLIFSEQNREKSDALYELFQVSKLNPNALKSFSKESNIQNVNYEEIKNSYGKFFANKIISLKQGVWYKNIHSKLGKHLLIITNKNILKPYSFDEVQDRVYKDFLREHKEKNIQNAYTEIETQYSLDLE